MSKLLLIGLLTTMVMGVAAPAYAVEPNLVANPSAETLLNGQPVGWQSNKWGRLSAQFSILHPGQDGSVSLYVKVSNRRSGDAKWYFTHVPVQPSTTYDFSDYYRSNVKSDVTVEVKTTAGTYTYIGIGEPIASAVSYTKFSASFTTPSNAQSVTVFHNLDRNGWLQSDNYSLTQAGTSPPPPPPPSGGDSFNRPLISIEFDDGWRDAYEVGLPIVDELGLKTTQYIITETTQWPDYMDVGQIQAMKAAGHDIGSHTVSHPHLPQLSSSQITAELSNAKSFLENLLGTPVNLLVTPYCEWNTTVRTIAQQYYTSMRNCEHTPNTKANFDIYNIHSYIVLRTTTLAELQSWIEEARAQNGWLVLVYHQVRDNGDDWSISASALRTQLEAVKASGITTLKTADALAEIRAQL